MKKILLLSVLFLSFYPIFAYLPSGMVLAIDKVEINTASLEQLDEIIGIGPVLAQRIIDARPFSSLDDLLRVKGIGEKTLQKIKDQGLAYVGEKSEIQNPKSETNSNAQNSNNQNAVKSPTSTPDSLILSPNITPGIACPNGIYINEILPSPEGADAENEWIEIFNQSENTIDLSGFVIKDSEGTITSYVFPENSKIASKEYLVLKRGTTKITLNNTSDKLELLCGDKIMDSVGYEKAKTGQSYNRGESEWYWSQVLTPGKENIVFIAKVSQTPSQKNYREQLSASGEKIDFQQKETANIGEKAKNLTEKSYPLVIAVFLAVFSGAIIFILKKVLKTG